MKKPMFPKRRPSEEMSLQITSMADIFTILLVFLLKSYATAAIDVSPSQGLSLPVGTAETQSFDALKVEVSQTAVQIEGQPVAQLDAYRFRPQDLAPNGSSQALSKALDTHRKRQLLIAQANPDVKVDPKVLVIADKHVPYSTIKTVLASAALQGYTDFKLAVVRDQ